MLESDKGLQIISAIPQSRLLTETDAPFTFDASTKDRLTALQHAVEGLAKCHQKEAEINKTLVYQNFKKLLSAKLNSDFYHLTVFSLSVQSFFCFSLQRKEVRAC